MGIQYEEPKYPVIDKDPSVSNIYSNFNFTDYLRITTFTSSSLVYGYLAGKSLSLSLSLSLSRKKFSLFQGRYHQLGPFKPKLLI